jgi:hypothetical protein
MIPHEVSAYGMLLMGKSRQLNNGLGTNLHGPAQTVPKEYMQTKSQAWKTQA